MHCGQTTHLHKKFPQYNVALKEWKVQADSLVEGIIQEHRKLTSKHRVQCNLGVANVAKRSRVNRELPNV